MPTFSAIIELHNANEDDYFILDNALRKETARSEKRNALNYVNKALDSFKKANYMIQGNMAIQDVINSVLNAATKTGKKFSFTVVKKKG